MKFDAFLRFAFIETRLYWEDGLAAKDLVAAFDLSRQTAQAVIDDYRTRYPDQMEYDAAKKRHVMMEGFKPRHISPRSIDFLDFLRGDSLRKHYLDEECDWSALDVYDVDRLLRPAIPRHIMQPILAALRHKQTLCIEYRSKYDNPIRSRIISPNKLVFADDRYHLLAYCHVLNKYIDFVLSRILSVEPAHEDWVPVAENCEKWRQTVLRFRPNPELPEEVRDTLLRNYAKKTEDVWEISCTQDAAYYIRRKLKQQLDQERKIPLWIEI